MIRLFAVALALAAIGASGLPHRAEAATGQGNFTAKVEVKALRNQKTGRTPQLPFSGTFAHTDGKFRMDLTNDITTERQIFILDRGVGTGWVLFPDTLNGITASLDQIDTKGMVAQAETMIGGGLKSVPKDWKKASSKQATLGGKQVTEVQYTLPKSAKDGGKSGGGTLTYWHAANEVPVKLIFDSASIRLTVDFAEVTRGGSVAETQFKPGKNYKLRALGKDEAFPMPGGVGSGMV